MITDLRNPSLKSRHWEAIETELDFHFTADEPMTLGRLEDIGSFYHGDVIGEVASQASSEASLEIILKKVSGRCGGSFRLLMRIYPAHA